MGIYAELGRRLSYPFTFLAGDADCARFWIERKRCEQRVPVRAGMADKGMPFVDLFRVALVYVVTANP